MRRFSSPPQTKIFQNFDCEHTKNCISGHVTSNFGFGGGRYWKRYRKGRGEVLETVSEGELQITNLKIGVGGAKKSLFSTLAIVSTFYS